jgi:hypothetical protein
MIAEPQGFAKANRPTGGAYSSLAECRGRGMSFKIVRGTLGSLAILTAIRNASSRDTRFAVRWRVGSSSK